MYRNETWLSRNSGARKCRISVQAENSGIIFLKSVSISTAHSHLPYSRRNLRSFGDSKPINLHFPFHWKIRKSLHMYKVHGCDLSKTRKRALDAFISLFERGYGGDWARKYRTHTPDELQQPVGGSFLSVVILSYRSCTILPTRTNVSTYEFLHRLVASGRSYSAQILRYSTRLQHMWIPRPSHATAWRKSHENSSLGYEPP